MKITVNTTKQTDAETRLSILQRVVPILETVRGYKSTNKIKQALEGAHTEDFKPHLKIEKDSLLGQEIWNLTLYCWGPSEGGGSKSHTCHLASIREKSCEAVYQMASQQLKVYIDICKQEFCPSSGKWEIERILDQVFSPHEYWKKGTAKTQALRLAQTFREYASDLENAEIVEKPDARELRDHEC
jgi:hypothetical protein